MYLNRCCTTTTATATTTTCWYHWPKFKSGICSRRQKDRHKHIQTWRQKHRPTKRETDRQTDRRPKQKKRLFWRNSLVGVFFLSASRRLSFFSTKFVLPSLPPTALAFVSRPFGLRYNFHFRWRWRRQRRQRRQRRRRRRCRIFVSRRRVDSKKGTSVFFERRRTSPMSTRVSKKLPLSWRWSWAGIRTCGRRIWDTTNHNGILRIPSHFAVESTWGLSNLHAT